MFCWHRHDLGPIDLFTKIYFRFSWRILIDNTHRKSSKKKHSTNLFWKSKIEQLKIFIVYAVLLFTLVCFSRCLRGNSWTLEIVIQEVLWSIRGSCWAIWNNPLTNVKWHSDPWPTVTSPPIRLSTNFMTFIPSLIFTELWVVSMEHLQRVWLASRERLPFRTPGSVPHFGTC